MNPLLPPAHLDAATIVRASQSSFVPAFRLLASDRRRDLEIFYAFCRRIDDIADAGNYPTVHRYEALEAWRDAFRDPAMRGLPENLATLIGQRGLDRQLFLELLDGTATDLASSVRMATRTDLDLYCHRVAGTVGQLCLPIFGANAKRAADYAETLGRALQYTNILRDTASDLEHGRIYYPLDELAAAGVSEDSFPAAAENYWETFARQTGELYRAAEEKIPPEDRTALRPAQIMAAIYRTLLEKMQRDGLRVTKERYRLSTPDKLLAIGKAIFARQ